MNSNGSYSNTVLSNEGGGIFSRIKNAGSGLSNNTFIIIAIVILFVLLAVFYYYYYVSPTMGKNMNYSSNNEPVITEANGNGQEAELLFFYTNWCPHCKTAKPIWNELKTEYENKTINGYKIIFTDVDCSTETEEVDKMMNQYSVEGYPTIKLLKDNQVVEYDAKPTKTTMEQFLKTVL